MDIHYSFPDADTLRYHHFCDETPKPSSFARHCHEFYELIYVVKGSGKYIVEGAQFFLRPHTLLLLRPREFHYVEITPGVPYERYVLHFYPGALDASAQRVLSAFDNRPIGDGHFYEEEDLPLGFADMVRQFEYAIGLSEEDGVFFSRLRLAELLLFMSYAAPRRGEQVEDQLGARVIRYLNENIHMQIRLDELARKFFVSKYYLCRAFKEQNGISIHGYLNRKRILLAKQLIDGGETATCAALKVGFGDYSSFYRAYKKIIGRAPSEK